MRVSQSLFAPVLLLAACSREVEKRGREHGFTRRAACGRAARGVHSDPGTS